MELHVTRFATLKLKSRGCDVGPIVINERLIRSEAGFQTIVHFFCKQLQENLQRGPMIVCTVVQKTPLA